MKNLVFESEFWLPISIDKVWAFGSDPRSLAKITPKKYGLSIDGAEAGCVNGTRLNISLAPFGVPLPIKWVAVLSGVESEGEQRCFVDTQESGPFSFWVHTHSFESGLSEVTASHSQKKFTPAERGTWVKDYIEYRLPMGELGALMDRYFGRRQLERMFADRRKAMVEHFLP